MRDRADGVGDGDVNDGHRAARAARAELLAEDVVLIGRRVIETGGVNRHFVPAMNRIERAACCGRLGDLTPSEAVPIRFVKVGSLTVCEDWKAKPEGEQK